jgi:shikimate kinase
MNIAVTGFSGTGKTTVSRLLAMKLNRKLISSDEEVRKITNLSAQKIVQKYGWERLREAEAEAIDSISELDEYILDTSCGIIFRNENIVNIKRNGVIILLTANPKIREGRLRRKEEKPDFTKTNYIDKTKGALSDIEERYRKAADYTIDTSGMSPGEACDLIVHYMQMEIH